MPTVITWILLLMLVFMQNAYAQSDSLWSRAYGGEDRDGCNTLIQTEDNGFLLAGYCRSFGEGLDDFYIIRTNEAGEPVWSRTYGGENNDICRAVLQNEDGSFILAGHTWSFAEGEADIWLIKTNEDGDTLWQQTYGGDSRDECFSIIPVPEIGYALAGYTGSLGEGAFDFYLVFTDENGEEI